jgi:hypothetical protein
MPTRRHDHEHPGDAMALFQEDHQRVRDLFQDYAVAHDPRAQRVIAEEACTELDIHAQMEEAIFSPAVEDAVEVDRQEMVEDSLREHQAITDVMRALREMGPDDTQCDAPFRELQVLVEHHGAKAEADLLPLAQEARAEDLDEMSAEMYALQQELMASSLTARPLCPRGRGPPSSRSDVRRGSHNARAILDLLRGGEKKNIYDDPRSHRHSQRRRIPHSRFRWDGNVVRGSEQ